MTTLVARAPAPWIETRVVRYDPAGLRGFVEFENPETTMVTSYHWHPNGRLQTEDDAREMGCAELALVEGDSE